MGTDCVICGSNKIFYLEHQLEWLVIFDSAIEDMRKYCPNCHSFFDHGLIFKWDESQIEKLLEPARVDERRK